MACGKILKTKYYKASNELKNKGYLSINPIRNSRGRILGHEWITRGVSDAKDFISYGESYAYK